MRTILIVLCFLLVSCEESSPNSGNDPEKPQYGSIGIRITISPGSETNWCNTSAGYNFDVDYSVTGTTSKDGGTYGSWYGEDKQFHLVAKDLQAGSNYVISISGEGGGVCASASFCDGKIGSFDLSEVTVTTMPGGGPIVVRANQVTELTPITLTAKPKNVCS